MFFVSFRRPFSRSFPQWTPTCTDQFALADPALWNAIVIAIASIAFIALIAAILYKRFGSFGACARACGMVWRRQLIAATFHVFRDCVMILPVAISHLVSSD